MNNIQKQNISEALKKLAQKESQNKLAVRAGISPATLSHMINGKWELIKAEMWKKTEINLNLQSQWATAETKNYKDLQNLLQAVKTRHLSIAISDEAGRGKSHSYKAFQRENENVYLVEVKSFWSKKSYAKALLTACGIDPTGTTEEMIEKLTDFLKSAQNPILIIDQADKLKDPCLDFFVDLYNEVAENCSLVISGVPALKIRILKGTQRDKSGYKELFSRIGRRFIPLKPITIEDVKLICIANGIENDEEFWYAVYNGCEGDLRRVRQEVEKYFLLKKVA